MRLRPPRLPRHWCRLVEEFVYSWLKLPSKIPRRHPRPDSYDCHVDPKSREAQGQPVSSFEALENVEGDASACAWYLPYTLKGWVFLLSSRERVSICGMCGWHLLVGNSPHTRTRPRIRAPLLQLGRRDNLSSRFRQGHSLGLSLCDRSHSLLSGSAPGSNLSSPQDGELSSKLL